MPDNSHGAYSRAELNGLLTPRRVDAAVDDGKLARFSRGVLVDPKRATEFATRAAAALLLAGPEAVLTRTSALAMHGCSAAEGDEIHVLMPYRRRIRRRPGVVVHQGCFEERDVERIGDLRVLALDVALAEVLCRGDRVQGIQCADQALAMFEGAGRAGFRAWTAARIRARPDPRGHRRGLALLDLATGLAESPMESWLLLTIADAGLPAPEQQFEVFNLAGKAVYRLDFAWPQLRIASEYDGYEAHETRRERDAARYEDLRRRGWIVIRADADDLKDPARVIAAIKDAFRQRGMGV